MNVLPAISNSHHSSLNIADMKVTVKRVTEKTHWIFVQIKTKNGLTGSGEASNCFRTEAPELTRFFELVKGESPFHIKKYRKRGWPLVLGGGLNEGTAFSAIEQALWDLSGQALGVPVYDLLGGKLHNRLKVYANINRATVNRIPAEFAEKAAQAAEQGFCGVKAAVFDGFPNRSASRKEKERAIINGIACVAAMRRAIGPDVRLMVDCHSFFNVEMAIDVAQRLEPFNLYWYEEPVSPKQIEDTAYIHKSIKQPMAGGEFIFGAEGFSPLCRSQGVDIIMPDVNHCGGILEGYYISRNAEVDGIAVAPHNPYGPVTTAAAIQLCAGLPNFDMLEYQWGETEWRKDLTDPPEHIEKGYITIPDRPGLGVTLQP